LRWFGWSVSACLGSNVTRCGATCFGLFIVESRVTPRAATTGRGCETSLLCWSVVHDGQRPAPAGQVPGDRGVCDGASFLPVDERHPASVQAPVALVTADAGRGGRGVPSVAQHGADLVAGPVVPGGLDEQSAHVPVAGLGDRPPRAGSPGGVFGR